MRNAEKNDLKPIRNIWSAGASEALRQVLMDLLCVYFRAELRGVQHIPRNGPAILIANHSGYAALDAVVMAHLIHRYTQRRPRVMAHRAYFEWSAALRRLSFAVGLREAHVGSALRTLRHGHLLIVFPEGAAGNFKSSLKRYRLQTFHSGFLRMALRAKVPIVPCVITGSEEAFLNLGSIDLGWLVRSLRIPLPVNLFPFPAKLRIRVTEPIEQSELRERDLSRTSEWIRERLQKDLLQERKARRSIFFQ